MCSTLSFIFANKTSKTIPQILTVSRVFHIGSTPQGRYRLAAGKKTLQTLCVLTKPDRGLESLVSPVVNQQIANPYIIYFFSPCFPTIILVTIFNQWRCKISFYSIVFLQHQCWSSLVAIGQSRYYQSTFTSHTLSWHPWHQYHLAATFSNLLIFSAISR